MSIRPISDSLWRDIERIQAQAYCDLEPESLAVLQSKWLRSPESCFVYQKADKTVGYLLAHRWHSLSPPKLYQTLPEEVSGDILFLHDLALSQEAAGEGIGSKMIEYLVALATKADYRKIVLVSVQASERFWGKQGFQTITSESVDSAYGEEAALMVRSL